MVVTASHAPKWARGYKLCRTCGSVKGLREYSRRKSALDGRHSNCKACAKGMSASYYQRNTAKIMATVRTWQQANPERKREIDHASEWRDRGRTLDLAHARNHKRRAAKLAVPSDGWTRAELLARAEATDTYGCYWCGGDAGKDWQADHGYPISRGGHDITANMVISCAPCNRSKNDRIPFTEWEPPLS